MQIARHRAAEEFPRRYRYALDWSEGRGYAGYCMELPHVTAGGPDLDSVLSALRLGVKFAVASYLCSNGMPPQPLSQIEGPLGGWCDDLELVSAAQSADAPAEIVAQSDDASSFAPIALSMAWRYRIMLEAAEQGYVAASPEIAAAPVSGATPAEAVAALREELCAMVLGLLQRNLMPPEPQQEIERRKAPLFRRAV